MKNTVKQFLAGSVVATALAFGGNALAMQTTAPAAPKSAPAPKTAAKPAATAPSDSEIADAKAKGMVWVNTNTKVYHKDGEFYGKTAKGKFMAEADAQKAGYHLAKPSPVSKKKTSK
jgi:hypothetical protein